jgi:hypothetical protein
MRIDLDTIEAVKIFDTTDADADEIWHAVRKVRGRPTDTYCGYPGLVFRPGPKVTWWGDLDVATDLKCNDCADALLPPAPAPVHQWQHVARALAAWDIGTDYPTDLEGVDYAERTYGREARKFLAMLTAAEEWSLPAPGGAS